MYLLLKTRQFVMKYFSEMRWYGVLLSIAVYVACSWLMLLLCGEHDLVAREDFLYWLVVTASTVGYGDLSPVTTAGKLVVALFVVPLGLGMFALAIGRLAAFISFQWRKGVQGLKSLNMTGHILIVGWDPVRTIPLIELLLREQEYSAKPREVALVVQQEMVNPLPDKIGFVRARSFSDEQDMSRACLADASCVIIDNPEDDVTMTAALYCSSRNSSAHIIAYFRDEQLGRLLKAHCPNIECTPSVAVEMLAKAAVDPGSSRLHHQLLNVQEGMTQYSVQYPDGASPTRVEVLFDVFKRQYEATLIGLMCPGEASLRINPCLQDPVLPGATVHYIADERIENFDWEQMRVAETV